MTCLLRHAAAAMEQMTAKLEEGELDQQKCRGRRRSSR
jgi:hypothetical protein